MVTSDAISPSYCEQQEYTNACQQTVEDSKRVIAGFKNSGTTLTGTRCSRRTSKRILWSGRTERVRSLGMSVGGLLIQVQQLAGSTHSSHSTVCSKARVEEYAVKKGSCKWKFARALRDQCAAYRAIDAHEREADAGLPVLGRLRTEGCREW
jgi:hypothetical protein